MKLAKISVLMSVFNGEAYLSEAIESILDQTYKNFEFIIINDCSTDNSKKILRKYAKADKRIQLINNKQNLGLTKSLNFGLKNSHGEFVARMDSDDISLPIRLEEQYNYLKKNRDIFLVGAGALIIDSCGNTIKQFKPILGPKKIKKSLLKKNVLYHPSIMFRNQTSYFYRDKFIYAQDYDYYLNLLTNNEKMNNIFKPLIKYRINPQGITCKKLTKQKLFAEKAREFYFQRLINGVDEYSLFEPNEILNIDVGRSKNKIVLESEIELGLRLNNFSKVKKLSKIYFQNYGLLNKITFYYLASFLGQKAN